MATISVTRKERGAKIPDQEIERVNASSYWVKSQSSKGGYSVTNFPGVWSCECFDQKFRGIKCKHIYAVESAISTST